MVVVDGFKRSAGGTCGVRWLMEMRLRGCEMIVAVGVGCKFAAGGEELYLGVVGGECGGVDWIALKHWWRVYCGR
jgi:hypothetical protein